MLANILSVHLTAYREKISTIGDFLDNPNILRMRSVLYLFNYNLQSTWHALLLKKKIYSLQGYSTSETWYAVLDYSTNYCNMRNLLEGRFS